MLQISKDFRVMSKNLLVKMESDTFQLDLKKEEYLNFVVKLYNS